MIFTHFHEKQSVNNGKGRRKILRQALLENVQERMNASKKKTICWLSVQTGKIFYLFREFIFVFKYFPRIISGLHYGLCQMALKKHLHMHP